MAFTVGRDLLVAASPRPEQQRAYDICLPSRGWYDYWTGLQVTGEKISEIPRLDHLPVFVRPGAIIAKQPLVQSTSETPKGTLQVEIYPGEDCHGELYLDDGVTVNGPKLHQDLSCTVTEHGVALRFGAREGAFKPWWKQIAVMVHGATPKHMIIVDQAHAATVQIR
jgi:alpha-glucosidase